MTDQITPVASPDLPKRCYRIAEVAYQLSISERKVYDLINQGAIRAVRVGQSRRVLVEDLEQFIEDITADRDAGLVPFRPVRRAS